MRKYVNLQKALASLCAFILFFNGFMLPPTAKTTQAQGTQFTELTFEDYGISNHTYEAGSDGAAVETNKVSNLDHVAFTGTLTFAGSESRPELNCIRIGGLNQYNTWTGLGIYYENGIVLWDYTGATTENGGQLCHVKETDSVSFRDQAVIVRLTFEYINDARDVRLEFWINGINYFNKTVYGLASKLGTGLLIYTNDAPVTVESFVRQTMPSDGLKDISVADFAIEKTTIDGIEEGIYWEESIENTRFSTYITLKEGHSIYYGGTAGDANGIWDGIVIKVYRGTILVSDATHNAIEDFTMYQEIAGVDFIGQQMKLSITTEYVDSDCDGIRDDVMLGIYFNDKLYNNEPVILPNRAGTMGNGLLFYNVSSEPIRIQHLNYERYNLAYGPYLFSGKGMQNGTGTVTVNHEGLSDWTLSKPGDYTIRSTGDGAYQKRIVLYYYGDAHPDGEIDVRDLVAVKKALAGLSLQSDSAEKGADADGNGIINTRDLSNVRDNLLGPQALQMVKDHAIYYAENVMPIGGYSGPRRTSDKNGGTYDYLTDEYYRMIKDLGINLITYTTSVYHMDEEQKKEILEGLALAQKYGIGVFVKDGRLGGLKEMPAYNFSGKLSDFAEYTSFKGFAVIDEPFTEYYGYKYWIQNRARLEDYDEIANNVNSYTNTFGYVNLNPMTESLGGSNYKENYERYLEEYIRRYNARLLSFDYYPFDKGATKKVYFENLDIIRATALEHKIPFWTYIQAGTNWNDNVNRELPITENNTPAKSEMMWNVNTSLAYGAKGIQYFPLIQPPFFAYATGGKYDYGRNGLIGANGVENKWYHYARDINKQIAAVDEVLMNANSLAVLAIGGTVQMDTGISKTTYESLAPENPITASNGAIAGVFDYQGKKAFYIVNYDIKESQTITVNFDGRKQYSIISSTQDVNTSGQTCVLNLEAGGAALVVLK